MSSKRIKKMVSFNADPSVHDRLHALAATENRTVSNMVVTLLLEAMAHRDKIAAAGSAQAA